MKRANTDENFPTGDETASRRGRKRGLPDLGSIFEEIDSQTPSAPKPNPKRQTKPRAAPDLSLPDLGGGAPAEATPADAKAPAVSPPAALGFPRADGESRPPALFPPREAAEEGQAGKLSIHGELEKYLPADLWRKLNSSSPSRGVLISVLDRTRSILYLLSTFLPNHLVQEKMRRPVRGLVNGQILRGALLFSDVSGFTALSERLAVLGPEGAEQLTAIMNRYFAAMLEILAWSGGTLLKFAGDATLVYFPEQENGQQANWAVRAGRRMLRAMDDFSRIKTPTETVSLRMKIGVASGEFLAASVGSAQRMEYVILGPAVADTMAAEGATSGAGQLVIDQATRACLDTTFDTVPHKPGFYLVDQIPGSELDDFEIKAETRRARGAIPWNASPHAILAQVEVAIRQIQALTPFLASELVERIVVQARQRRIDSQYRPTTVIFCNFVGLENLFAMWGSEGSERITGLLSAYFNAMQEVITRYGGIVSRVDPYSSGNKMLILFGAPVAHEDDPQRAASAALAMNVELESLNESWRRKFARYLPAEMSGPLIQQRIGITYGDTFAGQVGSSTRREYTVMGDDVNLAARLMGAAQMGQILLSDRVYDAVGDYFVLTGLHPIKVKGKSKPIPIFQLEGPRDDTLVNRVHKRGRLIGREDELANSQAFLSRALQGRGGILILQGPAGVGKSHLADELLKSAAAQNALLIPHQCRSFAAETPYACWSSILRSLAGITSSDYLPQTHLEKLQRLAVKLGLPEAHLHGLANLIGLKLALPSSQRDSQEDRASAEMGGEVGAMLEMLKKGKARRRASRLDVWQQIDGQPSFENCQLWQPFPAPPGQQERDQLNEAIWSLLSNLAAERPAVLFFEDAHWMDGCSREALATIDRKIRDIPALIMMARRQEKSDEKFGKLVVLEPLNEAGTTALVAHLLVSDLAQVIYEQSSGNPLFVSEITRWFQRTRNINAAELKSVMQTSNILQKLVLSSVECLPPEQREIARLASVIGNEFRTGEVQALLPDSIDPVSLSNHLRGLVRARLIGLAEAGADARYAFEQSLVRDVLYNSMPYKQRRELHGRLADYLNMPQARRRQVHARIAAALDALPAGGSIPAAETVAHHYEQAQRWQAAAEAMLAAGNHARQQKAQVKALAAFSRAAALLEKLPGAELDEAARAMKIKAWLGQGDIALLSGDYLPAASAYETACACLPDGSKQALPLDLACKLALALTPLKRENEAQALLQTAIESCNVGRVGNSSPASDRNVGRVGNSPPACAQTESGQTLTACPTLAGSYAVMAWLLWRAGNADSRIWAGYARENLPDDGSVWATQLRPLLSELEYAWDAAVMDYLAVGNTSGAAIAALHWGDRLLREAGHAQALVQYNKAVEIWEQTKDGQGGACLALYRQAEAHWQAQDMESCLSALHGAQAVLSECSPDLQIEGRSAIKAALKAAERGKPRRWPAWRWQAYDDAFHIALLIPPPLPPLSRSFMENNQ